MISQVQIQTTDSCDARCIMCPHKDLAHTFQEIEEGLFAKIIREIDIGITNNLIVRDPKIFLFFHNEPLCDPNLFDRIIFIKNLIPESSIQVFTNGLQLPRYLNQLINSRIDLLYISLYGYDHTSFNEVTGLNITPAKYQEIIDTIEELKKHLTVNVASSWVDEHNEKKLFNYSSRAGFYTSKTLHQKVKGCSSNRIEGWLNFFSSGKLTLCCMDWRKEAIVGDITTDNLEAIIQSEKYKEIKEKAHGILPSPPDFICKRCEWAIPDNEVPSAQKLLIITAASEDRIDYLIDFVISLRYLGGYKGEILVLNYGIPETFLSFFRSFDVEFINAETPDVARLIVNHRLSDIYPIIKQRYSKDYLIALFDVDIWFQQDISSLFEEVINMQGCLYASEFRPGFYEFGKGRGPSDPLSEEQNLEKMTAVVKEFDGHLNAGLMAAKSEVFIQKIEQILDSTHKGYDLSVYGMDQYLYNLLFDFEKDKATGKKWNCVLNDVLLEGKEYVVANYKTDNPNRDKKDSGWSVSRGEKAVGIHCYNVVSPDKQKRFRFSHLYQDLLKEIISGYIFEVTHEISQKIEKIKSMEDKKKPSLEKLSIPNPAEDLKERLAVDHPDEKSLLIQVLKLLGEINAKLDKLI